MNIYASLSKFQKSVPSINKDSKGHGYNYASLDNIVEVITPHLKECGLGFTHVFEEDCIVCILFNDNGDTIKSKLKLTQDIMKGMNSNQAMGASITYARRYTLTSILGLITDEDTDGVATPTPAKQPVIIKSVHPQANNFTTVPSQANGKCEVCGEGLVTAVKVFSKLNFGRELCREHQKTATKIKNEIIN